MKKGAKETVRQVAVRMPKELFKKLKQVAENRGVPVVDLIKDYSFKYVEGQKQFQPSSRDETHRFSLLLDEEVREVLRGMATTAGISLEEAIRQIARTICEEQGGV